MAAGIQIQTSGFQADKAEQHEMRAQRYRRTPGMSHEACFDCSTNIASSTDYCTAVLPKNVKRPPAFPWAASGVP